MPSPNLRLMLVVPRSKIAEAEGGLFGGQYDATDSPSPAAMIKATMPSICSGDRFLLGFQLSALVLAKMCVL
jgi:hypothetical protein